MRMMLFLLCAVILGSVRCDEEAAVAAIQSAVFGGRTQVVEPALPMALSSSRGQTKSRKKMKMQGPVVASALHSGQGAHYNHGSGGSPGGYRAGGGSSQGLSFQSLSAMNVKSAPKQATFYRPANYERLPVIEPCQAVACHLSMAIVMDSSGSVGYSNFQQQLSFVQTLLEILHIKADEAGLKVCAGVVRYSTSVQTIVDPCCQNSLCKVVEEFSNGRVAYNPGSTNTHGALKVARQMLQGPRSIKKVLLLITDGKSNTGGSPVRFAQQMRTEDDIAIVAFGVTDGVRESELRGISGLSTVVKIDTFDNFHDTAAMLLEANSMGSEDLDVTFESLCYGDTSTFSNTCVREEETEEPSTEPPVVTRPATTPPPACVWGAWSTCTLNRGSSECYTNRSCKRDGTLVDRETHLCTCDASQMRSKRFSGFSFP